MDTMQMKDRNYRVVEQLRQSNLREQRRLEDKLTGRLGIQAAYKYTLAEVKKEQCRIRQELAEIRNTTANTNGRLPSAEPGRRTNNFADADGDAENHTHRRRSYVEKKHEEETKKTIERLQEFNKAFPLADDRPETKSPSPPQKAGNGVISESNEVAEPATELRTPRYGMIHSFSYTEPVNETATPRYDSTPREPTQSSNHTAQTRQYKIVIPSCQDDHIQDKPLDNKDILKTNNTNGETSLRQKNEIPLSDINIVEAKQNVMKRLAPARVTFQENDTILEPKISARQAQVDNPKKTNGASKKKTNKGKNKTKTPVLSDVEEKHREGFDPLIYNPDGTLRTVHTLPDFHESLLEAKKARYLRLRTKQWYEIQLTVSEIFDRDN